MGEILFKFITGYIQGAILVVLIYPFPVNAQVAESVKVLRVDSVQVKQCGKKESMDATQGAATIGGAAAGAYAGNLLLKGLIGKPASTVVGAVAGGTIGYQATKNGCQMVPAYNVVFERKNGKQGAVVLHAPPPTTVIMVSMCGDIPCQ